MDDSPKGIFIRETAFCLIKTVLFCIVTMLSNIILLIIWAIIFARLQLNQFTVYFGFSLFVTVSAVVFFLIGRYLLAFDEKSPKDYAVPVMIFIAGISAIIIFRDNMLMFFMLSWNYFLTFLVNNLGSSAALTEGNTVPVMVVVWFICCCVMTAGIQFRLFNSKTKKIFIICAVSFLTVVLLALNMAGFILHNT